MKEYLKDKRIQWFGNLERMKEVGLVNVGTRFVIISLKGNQGKHGMR